MVNANGIIEGRVMTCKLRNRRCWATIIHEVFAFQARKWFTAAF